MYKFKTSIKIYLYFGVNIIHYKIIKCISRFIAFMGQSFDIQAKILLLLTIFLKYLQTG